MTDEELKALVASLAVDQKELSKKMSQTDEQMKRTDEQIASLSAAHKETESSLKRATDLLGNMGRNQGDVSEEFFYNSLLEDTRLGDIHFDNIAKNLHDQRGKNQGEYDIVMTNGNAVGIVEVKYKAHENDLDKLELKMENFKKLFPVYKNFKLYGAIASFHIYDEAKHKVLERGFFVLQQRGKILHTECGENLRVM